MKIKLFRVVRIIFFVIFVLFVALVIIAFGLSIYIRLDSQKDTRTNLQKAYDWRPARYVQEISNKMYDQEPVLPSGVYELALQEAQKPVYDIYRRTRGMRTEDIANMIGQESLAPLVSEVMGGKKWTPETQFNEDQWKRFDRMYENRFTAQLVGKPSEGRPSMLDNREELMGKFRENYAKMKENIPTIREQRALK